MVFWKLETISIFWCLAVKCMLLPSYLYVMQSDVSCICKYINNVYVSCWVAICQKTVLTYKWKNGTTKCKYRNIINTNISLSEILTVKEWNVALCQTLKLRGKVLNRNSINIYFFFNLLGWTWLIGCKVNIYSLFTNFCQ